MNLLPLLGGALIGLSVTLFLLFNGRVTGISGIVSGALTSSQSKSDFWRWAFILGLIAGGFIMLKINPSFFKNESGRSLLEIFIAGGLVGFGTLLGSGCTSGHGVCGISRWSPRSFAATITFILFGMIFTTLFHVFFKGAPL